MVLIIVIHISEDAGEKCAEAQKSSLRGVCPFTEGVKNSHGHKYGVLSGFFSCFMGEVCGGA